MYGFTPNPSLDEATCLQKDIKATDPSKFQIFVKISLKFHNSCLCGSVMKF